MNIPTGYRVRGQKTLALFSFVWRKRDCSLTTEYSFAKYLTRLLPLVLHLKKYEKMCKAGMRDIFAHW